MASKKPGKRPARKTPVEKAVPAEPAAPTGAAEPKAARKVTKAPAKKSPKKPPEKLPEIKAAVRVTKKSVKAVKSTSKAAVAQAEPPTDTQQSLRAAGAASMQPASPGIADSQQAAAEACPLQYARQISHDEIRHLAYLKWEAAGRPHGDGGHFWWEAERELMQLS